MPAVLPNTTTTDAYTDTQLGGNGLFSGGVLTIANNPVAILFQHGTDRGTFTTSEYPYVAPTTIPLTRGEREWIVGLQIKSAIAGSPAQVYGYLIEPGTSGLGVGTPFTQTISSSGQVTNPSANMLTGRISAAGAVVNGSGFTVTAHPSAGVYTVAYTTAFSATPVVELQSETANLILTLSATSATGFTTSCIDRAGTAFDAAFGFIAQAVI